MQFTVPQFIEVEDKLFGQLTFKQFLYVLGGAGGCYVWWQLVPFPFSFLFIIPTGGLAAALAFYTYNNRPFVLFLENGFFYLINSRLYLWKHVVKPEDTGDTPQAEVAGNTLQIPTLTEGALKSLSWNLDINEYVDKASFASSHVR
jgi:PrgI family protein